MGFFLQNYPYKREFYPLSGWGMYNKIYAEGPFSKFQIIYKLNNVEKDLLWEFGTQNYILNDILRVRVIAEDIGRYSQKAKEKITIEDFYKKHIVPLLKTTNLNQSGAKITIARLSWHSLNRENLLRPDKREILLERILN